MRKCFLIAGSICGFVVLLLFRPVNALLPTLPTTSSQCGSYLISWNRTHSNGASPPSTVYLIPVNPADAVTRQTLGYPTMNLSTPIIQTIPESVWNGTSQTGSYTISELPFRTGEAYIVAMDYGSGIATEDISSIYQVGSSPAGTACLTPSSYTAGVFINLTTYQAVQCGPFTTRTQQARAIRAFVLGGSMFNLALPPASAGSMTTTWNVSVPGGHQFVLLYEGMDGKNASSGWIEAIDNGVYGSECLGTDSSSGESMEKLLGSALNCSAPLEYLTISITTTPWIISGDQSTNSRPGPSTGAIVGIVLAAITITILLVYFCKFRNWWY